MNVPSIEQYIARTKKERSERDMLLNDLYALYDSPDEAKLRKNENIRRYKVWLREQKRKNTPEAQQAFMKEKIFVKKTAKSRLWFFVAHIPTKDLYYVLSVCRDRQRREESIGAYLYSLIKKHEMP